MRPDIEEIEKAIRRRAYFVGGIDAWFRSKNDPLTESAISDAMRFVKALPERCKTPAVTGGTTVSAENIVVLYWMGVSVDGGVGGVSVDFLGNGCCRVRGCGETRTVGVDDLLNLGISKKIDSLSAGSAPKPLGPTFH